MRGCGVTDLGYLPDDTSSSFMGRVLSLPGVIYSKTCKL